MQNRPHHVTDVKQKNQILVSVYDREKWEALVNTVMKLSGRLIRNWTVSFGLFCHRVTSVIRSK